MGWDGLLGFTGNGVNLRVSKDGMEWTGMAGDGCEFRECGET